MAKGTIAKPAAKKPDTANLVSRIEKLWNGGEKRRAAELFAESKFTEKQGDTVLEGIPGLREIVATI